MCCRASIAGLPRDWPLIMKMAGFNSPDHKPSFWQREIRPGVSVAAHHIESKDMLRFELYPLIAGHSQEDHRVNAPSASIMMKTMMTLAEKSGGQIMQEALVGYCFQLNGSQERLLASYPEIPLTYDRLCHFFQDVLLSPQIGETDAREVSE